MASGWRPLTTANESGAESFFFLFLLLLSCLCYFMAVFRILHHIQTNCFMFSCWITLGTLFGMLAVAQFEGVSLFLVRITKKHILLVTLCMVFSIVMCLVCGYTNDVSCSIFSSLFQFVCLIIYCTPYSTSFLCLSWNTLTAPKAKE